MKIDIKINKGLGINPESFAEYFKNSINTVYVVNEPNKNANNITIDPHNIVGRVESIDDLVAEITFIDTILGRSVEKIIDIDPGAFYIAPRVICDKEGNIKNLISFDLCEYDQVKCKEVIRMERPDKINYYLDIAKAVSARGTCIRRKFGSIIVKDDRIVSTGYVGAPRGRVNCCDRGTCYREENNIPSGTRYELCRSIHSEMNAIINASKEEMIDSTMYLVGVENDGTYTKNADCCAMCKRAIINSGISKVIIRIDDTDFKIINVNDWIINDDSLDIDHQGY